MADTPEGMYDLYLSNTLIDVKYHFHQLRPQIEFSGAIATENARFGPVTQHSGEAPPKRVEGKASVTISKTQ